MDYDVVKTAVQNAYKNFGHNDNMFYNEMNNFFTEGKKNPSVARIIMQENVRQNIEKSKQLLQEIAKISFADTPTLIYPEVVGHPNLFYTLSLNAAIKSINAGDMYKKTEELSEDLGMTKAIDFKRKWNELYPRTGKKRKRIIEANRISMDNVKRKASWLQKIMYAKTFAEYKKDYPKTFKVRSALISNNQIKEDGVTLRVQKWFKRFSYKRLIKDSFSFKK